MNVINQIKTGFIIGLQSIYVFLRRPWLLLYSIVPNALYIYVSYVYKFYYPILTDRIQTSLLPFPILATFSIFCLAAFVYHLSTIVEQKKLSFVSMIKRLASTIVSLGLYIILSLGIGVGLRYIPTIIFFKTTIQNMPLVFRLKNLINLLYYYISFYVLVFIVVERKNIVQAFIESTKYIWHTLVVLISGRISSGLIIAGLSMALFWLEKPLESYILVNFPPYYYKFRSAAAAVIQALPKLFAIINTTLSVLLYYWHKNQKQEP